MQALERLQKIDRSQEIDTWNVRIYFLSRNPLALGLVAMVIVVSGLLVAWRVQRPLDPMPTSAVRTTALKNELASPKPDAKQILELLPFAASDVFQEAPIDEWIQTSNLSQSEKMVAVAIWSSLRESEGEEIEPSADLLYYAHYVKPLRFANEFIGYHYLSVGNLDKAAFYLRREAVFPEAVDARRKLVDVLIEKHSLPALQELATQPAFADAFTMEHRIYLAAMEHRWSDMVQPLKQQQAEVFQTAPAIVALIAGLVWFIIALQAIQPPRLFSARTILPVLAVLAGMASTFPTLMASVWMEEVFGLRMSRDTIGKIAYFILGVGPREELVKLLFVVPFLPVLLKRGSRLEMIVVAGCVGLGFAVWENLHYFARFGSAVAFPRFLTANFFHFALTGLNGLALCDVLKNPVRRFLPFVGILVGTTLAHGAYDTLATFSQFYILELSCMVVFMIISLFFFHALHNLRDGSTDQFCIAGTLVSGLSILTAAVLIFASREVGLIPALTTFAITGIGIIMVVYMFYWQLGEAMSAVARTSNSRGFPT